MFTTKVKEVDFTGYKVSSNHPDIVPGDRYILLINGDYTIGTFSPVWFGHNYRTDSMKHGAGHGMTQFDMPGRNNSLVQKVWRVLEADGLRCPEAILAFSGLNPIAYAGAQELAFAESRKKASIAGRYYFNGVMITEESPIEAWLYKPTADKMPYVREDKDEDLY